MARVSFGPTTDLQPVLDAIADLKSDVSEFGTRMDRLEGEMKQHGILLSELKAESRQHGILLRSIGHTILPEDLMADYGTTE